MDPQLQEVIDALRAWDFAHTEGARSFVNARVSDYVNASGVNLPSDVQANVDAMNSAVAIPPSGTTLPVPSPTGTATPGMFSAKGIMIGSVVIPWVAVVAIGVFGFVAWKVAQGAPRRRQVRRHHRRKRAHA
jgi:hypothetical protein